MQKVFDILNAGPRRRFTVRGKDGMPFIVSNCVQAVARDAFAEGLLRLEEAGIPVVLHVHDEAVCEVPTEIDPDYVREIFAQPPEWMRSLPVEGEADACAYYKK